MRKIEGVIFDFNGTLFFDSEKHNLAWNKMSMLLRHQQISEQEMNEHIHGVPNQKVIDYLTRQTLSNEQKQEYSLLKESFYREYCQEDQTSFHLVEGVKEYFDYLKAHDIPFTIASASIKENIDFFVQSFHLDQWMDVNKIIYDNGSYVNKVQMFLDAAKLLNVNIENTLIFEDSISGIQNAYKAGCRQIVVVSQNNCEKLSQMPGVIKVIKDFKNLSNNEL